MMAASLHRVGYVLVVGIILHTANSSTNSYEALFKFYFRPPGERSYICPDDWIAHGPDCLRVYEPALSWDQASSTCQNMGAHLMDTTYLESNIFIGHHLETTSDAYWIGYRHSADQNTTNPINWDSAQPDPKDGDCARLINDASRLYPWRLHVCNRPLPFICEMEGWLEDEFHCLNGRHILNKYTCDGENDCGDDSDEADCEDNERYFERLADQSSMLLKSPYHPSFYRHSMDVVWVLEGPVGRRLQLEFTEFKTEPFLDVVGVYEGGSTVMSSDFVSSFSGNLGQIHGIVSSNNYMLVTFVSDNGGSTSSSYRFKATWSIADSVFSMEVSLTAMDTPQYLKSPRYPSGYYSNTKAFWVIVAESQWDVVTVMIDELSIGESDRLTVYDGDLPESGRELWTNKEFNEYQIVTSGGRYLYIELDASVHEEEHSFKLMYFSGCSVMLQRGWGKIKSPGLASEGYPILQTCSYALSLPHELHGRSLSVRVTDVDLNSDMDTLTVYEGNTTEDTMLSEYRKSDSDEQIAVGASAGQLLIVFESDPETNTGGFSLEYSVGCEDPVFNDDTLAPQFSTNYLSEFSVSCGSGHYFSQQEFGQCGGDEIVPDTEVTLSCEFGGQWNVSRLPQCTAVYCGPVPDVDNGFVVNLTTVLYEGEVWYGCFEGFDLSPPDGAVVQCLETGLWGMAPTCTAAQCPALTSNDVAHGEFNETNERGNDFGSVVAVVCEEGYELTEGQPVIHCNKTGHWTGPTTAVCTKLKCPVPPPPAHGSLDTDEAAVEYNDHVVLTCDTGYKIFNTTDELSIDLTCQADQILDPMPDCVDIVECDDSKCDTSLGLCHNTEGSYYCTCSDGYEVDGDTCLDIDECDVDTDGCEDNCSNSAPGYSCGCTEEGKVLFTEDGLNGYYVKQGEAELEKDHVLRINHSCIPDICPHPLANTTFDNGTLLVYEDVQYFYVGETVRFLCDLGYGIEGIVVTDNPERKNITCMSDGDWSEPVPKCVEIMCRSFQDQGLLEGVINLPEFFPDQQTETIPFGETVYMNCTVPGGDPGQFTRSRTCLYDVTEKEYALIGDPVECGEINCGSLDDLPGLVTDSIIDQTYNSTFVFECKEGFTLIPVSAETTVRCREDGRWDLGDLRCFGSICDDPGRPPDGSAQVTSFEESSVVVFSCDRAGFEPSPANMTCTQIDSTTVEWRDIDDTSPSSIVCEDIEAPVINNCPEDPLYVFKYQTINLTAEVTDNSGAVKAIAYSPSSDTPITEDVLVNWTAIDHNNNSVMCQFDVMVASEVPPSFPDGCPSTVMIELNTSDSQIIDTSDYMVSALAGTPGLTVINSTDPAQLTVDGDDLYKGVTLTQTAEDSLGNRATCVFQALPVPGRCAEWAFQRREPEHGTISFTDDKATVACAIGYSFYGVDTTTLEYTCNDDGEFENDDQGTYVAECVASKKAEYNMVIEIRYGPADDSDILDLDNAIRDVYADYFKSNVAAAISSELSSKDPCPQDSVTVSVSTNLDTSGTTPGQFILKTQVEFDGPDSLAVDRCTDIVKVYLQGNLDIIPDSLYNLNPPDQIELMAAGTTGNENRLEEDGFICSEGEVLQREVINGDTYYKCFPCPPGYFSNNSQCQLCDLGSYQDEIGQDGCKSCPNGTSTLGVGGTSVDQCYDNCPSPLVSTTGRAPCKACPAGKYWDHEDSCVDCPSGMTAGLQGAASLDLCKDPCKAGYFSHDGFGPDCRPCPVGYHSDAPNSTVCTACSGQTSTLTTGSNSSTDCVDETAVCETITCQNGGTCQLVSQQVVCDCAEGYTGSRCEVDIDECALNPCYYGATCNDLVNDYSCTCAPISVVYMETLEQTSIESTDRYKTIDSTTPAECSEDCRIDTECRHALYRDDTQKCYLYSGEETFTGGLDGRTTFSKVYNDTIKSYSGDRCEIEPNDCPASGEDGYCENDSGCLDLDQGYRCLCRTNDVYMGDTCNETGAVCPNSLCENGASCEPDGLIRFKCQCVEGYTGEHCETDMDECSPNPCLNGGTCTDKINGFECTCPPLFTGDRCEIRPADLCAGSSCNMGWCVEDYINSAPLCVCDEGYTSGEYKTRWYDSSFPDTIGEMETLELHGDVCEGNEIVDTVCKNVDSGYLHGGEADQILDCDSDIGLVCYHSNQTSPANCSNYEVRYTCRVNGQSCKALDECTKDQCENSESCTDQENGYRCNCLDGYTGFNCQVDIDECDTEPCQHGGTCENKINGYTCMCEEGYTGTECQTNTDECDPDPCLNDGNCVDLVNDYQCDCPPGFTGKNCSDDINECLSSPCYHGADCTHGKDSYSCACPEGWEGDRCDKILEACAPDVCLNGATCREIFQGYFCDCPTGFTGIRCDMGESICSVADPCQNGAVCDSSTGNAVCTDCPSDYSGDGCQCLKHYGDDTDICQNGGTFSVESLGSYSCTCPNGFEGHHCETEIDFCASVNCQDGECVNGADSAVCICPYGKSGEYCTRDVDRDFDLEFTGKGQVKVRHSFFVNTTALTFAAWVRYTSESGTFLEVHTQESYTSKDSGGSVLHISESWVQSSLGESLGYTVVSAVPYNNGRWHSLVVIHNGDERKLTFIVDGIIEYKAITTTDTVIEYLSVSLGNEDFSGQISLVQVWDRALSSAEAVAHYNNGNVDNTADLRDDLVLDWTWDGYTAGRGTQRVQGSLRGLPVCSLGEDLNDDGDDCDITQDKLPPDAGTCPTTLTKTVAEGEHGVTFNKSDGWLHDDIFVGLDGEFNYGLDDVFGVGRYVVVYNAFDEAGNRASCRFNLIVALADCDLLLPSSADISGGVTCDSGESLVVSLPSEGYKCFEAGVFNILEPLTSFRVPECGDATQSDSRSVAFSWTYEFPSLDLDPDVHLPIIQSKVEEMVLAWSEEAVSGAFCEAADSCGNAEITASLGSMDNRADIEVVATGVSIEVNGVAMTILIQQAVLQSDSFTLEGVGGDANILTLSFVIESEVYCTGNAQVFNGQCVTCPAGTAYNSTLKVCVWAPVGQYQSGAGQDHFDSCTSGKTTETYGSVSADDCFDICNPGYKYTGSACQPCGIGFYQPMAGQTFCYMCEVGSTTYAENSTSAGDCVDLCGDGQRLMPNDQCEDCPIGTYRQRGGILECTKCHDDYTTESTGSVTEDECNIRVCPPGKFAVGDECVKCPQHSFRTEDMDNCTACPEGYRTDSDGVTSLELCHFFCEAGYYVTNKTGTIECVPCERDTYKVENEYHAEMCTACPENMPRTLGEGATTEDDCRYGRCVAGEYVNVTHPTECVPCPYNTYQENPDPVYLVDNCTDCPDNKGTDVRGANSSDYCMIFCEAGYYVSMDTAECVPCERDTYKVESEYYAKECTPCPDPMLRTLGEGAVSAADCRYGRCVAGEYVNVTHPTECVPCPYNTYQENPDPVYLVDNCTDCPDNKGTNVRGANSSDYCMTACPSGEFRSEDGDCEECPRGYYKDNTKGPQFMFGGCEACPVEFITEGTGAASLEECNIGNCTLGQFIDDNGQCQDCEQGFYQDIKWQTSCNKCVPKEATTETTGSTSLENCNVFPNVNRVVVRTVFEISFSQDLRDPTSLLFLHYVELVIAAHTRALRRAGLSFIAVYCTGFAQGSIVANTEVMVEESVSDAGPEVQSALISAINDGTYDPNLNPSDTVDAMETNMVCAPGEFFDFLATVVSSQCKPCPLGMYQPLARAGLCLACPDNKTTDKPGTINAEDCIKSCPAGQHSLDNENCVSCQNGYIKAEAGTHSCEECTGGRSTYGDDRTVCRVTCNPGFSSRSDGSGCDLCPEDQYSTKPDQTSCTACADNGTTARVIGSESPGACRNPCLALEDYCGTGTCNCDGGDCDTTFKVTCSCTEDYIGNRCETRQELSDGDTALIIGVTVSVVTVLILLASLFAYCYKTHKALKQPKKSMKEGYGDRGNEMDLMNPMYRSGAYLGGGYPGYTTSNQGYWNNPGYTPAMGYYPNYSVENYNPAAYNSNRAPNYDTGRSVYQQNDSGEDFYDVRRAGSLGHDPYSMQAVFQRS